MIKVYVVFPTYGNSAIRMVNSMLRYLPDDIQVNQVFNAETKFARSDYDIVITHVGAGAYIPCNAFVTPKAVISEVTDDVTMSYFTDRDILFSYNHDEVERLQEDGYNVVLWPRPVDTEIFHSTSDVKTNLVMSVCEHGDLVKITDSVVSRLGGKHLVMQHKNQVKNGRLNAVYDFCWAGKEDDRMVKNYSESMYSMSLLPDYEYRPGSWSCGFEVGVIEALLCGSVPVVLRSKHVEYMHKWLDGLVRWVDPDSFKKDIMQILSSDYIPVTPEQIVMAQRRFNASDVWRRFWEAIRNVVNV